MVREMNEHLSVETPEQIEIHYSIAGIGSRFYAALIDIVVLTPIVLIGMYVTVRAMIDLDQRLGNWLAAVAGVATFAIQWGYYMAFEITTNGQSPGKTCARITGHQSTRLSNQFLGFSDSEFGPYR